MLLSVVFLILLSADFPEVTRFRLEVIASDVVDEVVPKDNLVSIDVENVAELEFVSIAFKIVSSFEFAVGFTFKVGVGLVDFFIFRVVVVVIVDVVVVPSIVILVLLSADFSDITRLRLEDIISKVADGVIPKDDFVLDTVVNVAELKFVSIAFTKVFTFEFALGFTFKVCVILVDFVIVRVVGVVIVDVVFLNSVVFLILLSIDFPEVTGLRLEDIVSEAVDEVVLVDGCVSITFVNVAELEYVSIALLSIFEFVIGLIGNAVEFTSFVDGVTAEIAIIELIFFIRDIDAIILKNLRYCNYKESSFNSSFVLIPSGFR